MALFVLVLRILLGLDLLLNGIDFWLNFLPITTPASELARGLMAGLVNAGLFTIVKYIEIATAVALLSNRFVPLALVVMFPLTVVIFWTDCILIGTPEGWFYGGTTSLLHVLLVIAYLKQFMPLLAFRARPGLPDAGDWRRALSNREDGGAAH